MQLWFIIRGAVVLEEQSKPTLLFYFFIFHFLKHCEKGNFTPHILNNFPRNNLWILMKTTRLIKRTDNSDSNWCCMNLRGHLGLGRGLCSTLFHSSVFIAICVSLSRITQKLPNRFPWIFVEGWGMTQVRTHSLLERICTKGWILEFLFNLH